MKRLEALRPLINLRTENDFFVVRILQRRKDNPELQYPEKQLKVYSFYSWEEFDKQADRIKELCDLNNARAYLRLNTQNAVTISYLMQKEIIDNIMNGCAWKNEGAWNSVSGKGGSKDWWVLDLDEEHINYILDTPKVGTFSGLLKNLKADLTASDYMWRKDTNMDSVFTDYPIVENPTKSGIHLIVKPFDVRIMEKYNSELSSKGIPTIQVQKDANTVLYIGNEN